MRTRDLAEKGPLSFPRRGFTLALDLPKAPRVADAVRAAYRQASDLGVRLYLAKDAVADREMFREMYPQWRRFVEAKAANGATRRWSSELGSRLGLSPGRERE